MTGYYYNRRHHVQYFKRESNGSTFLEYGMWHILVAVTNVLCSDGKRRRVRITREADTWFSVPGSVNVKGHTVSGFIMFDSDLEVWRFHTYTPGKNSHLLP